MLQMLALKVKEAPDSALVKLYQAGNREAAEILVTRYDDELRKVASSLATDPHDVEDLVQDCWCVALQELPAYQSKRTFKSWLSHILGRQWRCMRTRQKRVIPMPMEAIELHLATQDPTNFFLRDYILTNDPDGLFSIDVIDVPMAHLARCASQSAVCHTGMASSAAANQPRRTRTRRS